MGVIYKITNKINGKIYIGQTVVTEPQRWQAHVWNAYNDPDNDCRYLCNAIVKHGKENFDREIIDEVNTTEELNDLEIFYIQKFNTTNPDIGYNISLGGAGHTKYDSADILNLYQRYHSVVAVAKELGATRGTIAKRLHGMGVATYNKTVNQYTIQGQFVNSFLSFAQAKCDTQLSLPMIIPKHHYSCGYFWIYDTDDTTIEQVIVDYQLMPYLRKKIQQYDTQCNLIQEFESAAEASKVLNINVSSIKGALCGSQYSAGGFLWHRADNSIMTVEDMYKRYLLSSNCCAIEEVDLFGNILGQYESATKLEKQLNWSFNCIKLVCDGKRTQTHGRIFRYVNPDKRQLMKAGG